MNSLTATRDGKGTREWSDVSHNICDGCRHGCLYCYAKSFRGRFDPTVRRPEAWQCQRLKDNTPLGKNVCSDQVVMFPTTHDIIPEFLDECLKTIENLLADGNKVLIVSKPHFPVVQALCRNLRLHKQDILFRFTIGSLDDKLCAFWEPGAPAPAERIQALRHAFSEGFATSVSIEPMLGSIDATTELVRQLESFVTDTLWIGKMQRIPIKYCRHIPGYLSAAKLVHKQQTDAEILRLVQLMKGRTKVRWKDSIKKVIAERSEYRGA